MKIVKLITIFAMIATLMVAVANGKALSPAVLASLAG
uniref:U12-MYRTX-Tb1a n=1 Tax=Tetramorium bicarinatum TaxID=219812 RepID=A0A6M3Z9M0_TETBN|nr:U12-MYRTX-Tb1a precursor [Tetramorium bicarinatum]